MNTALSAEVNGGEFDLEAIALRVEERRRSPVRKLNDLHEALADWMLVNPGGTLREMGVHFGYSVSWLCTVINSDMFQAYFAKRRGEVASFVHQSLPKKLEAAAHLATERIIEVVAETEDGEILLDAFDKILHRYGYAPNAKNGGAQAQIVQNTQNNVFLMNREDFAEARGVLLEHHKAPAPQEDEKSREANVGALPAPAT